MGLNIIMVQQQEYNYSLRFGGLLKLLKTIVTNESPYVRECGIGSVVSIVWEIQQPSNSPKINWLKSRTRVSRVIKVRLKKKEKKHTL